MEKEGYLVLRPVAVSKSGYPDLWVLRNGQVFFIEVKKQGEKATPLQALRHKELKEKGFDTYVVDDFAEVYPILIEMIKPNL